VVLVELQALSQSPPPQMASNATPIVQEELLTISFKNYRQFECELEIFLNGYGVTDNEKRILITLSFMCGQYFDNFIQEFVNCSTATDPPQQGTWANFKATVKARFQNKKFTQETRERLEHFKQNKMKVDDYFTQLDMMFTDTAVTEDAEKICIL
jgi:hypothetical protein